MTGMIVLFLLAAMAGSWLARVLLLQALSSRHPQHFTALGQPTPRLLESILPRYQNMGLQFWKFLWGKEVLQLDDRRVHALALAARCGDIALACSIAAFIWVASQHA